jgi:hypothetical protein
MSQRLVTAAFHGDLALVSSLLQDGLPPDQPGEACTLPAMTPLAAAAYNRKWDVVNYLLQQGADPNAGLEDDTSALMIAVYSRAPISVLLALLEHGADPLRRNAYGLSAMQVAHGRGLTPEEVTEAQRLTRCLPGASLLMEDWIAGKISPDLARYERLNRDALQQRVVWKQAKMAEQRKQAAVTGFLQMTVLTVAAGITLLFFLRYLLTYY